MQALFLTGLFLMVSGSCLPLFSHLLGRSARHLSCLLALISSISFFMFAIDVLLNGCSYAFSFPGPFPGVPYSFLVDRLSAFFIMTISVVAISVSIYSFGYVGHGAGERRKDLHCVLLNVFILSMILVTASENTLSFLMFWELMSLSSFLMVMYDYTEKDTRRAGLFYFIMTQLSTLFLFAAFLWTYSITGSFSIRAIPALGAWEASLLFLCLYAGFGIKAGIVPLHKWLPYAHPKSPSNISALMSGVMIKVAVYGIMRYTLTVIHPVMWWGLLILATGTLSAILGVIYALKEHDIKRLLAYHSIENIGIILIGYGLYIIYSLSGLPEMAMLCLAGALFHTLNHAIFKSLLFLAAGSVVAGTGIKNIEDMGGLVKRMPHTATLFLVGAVSISGLPPLNGFASEFMIFQAFLQSYALQDPFLKVFLIICLAIFALTSALAAACFVKAFGVMFLGNPRSMKAGEAREAGWPMLLGSALLAVLCVVLGVLPSQIVSATGYDLPVPDMLATGVILIVTYLLALVSMGLLSPAGYRMSDTWGCGYSPLGSRTQYTATGYSQPITQFFRMIYRSRNVREAEYFDVPGSKYKSGHAEIRLMKFFEECMYLPFARAVDRLAGKVSRLQNWSLDSYIAYAFIAILLVILYVGWSV